MLFVQYQKKCSAVRNLPKAGIKRKTIRRVETEFLNFSVTARRAQSQPEKAGGEASQTKQSRTISTCEERERIYISIYIYIRERMAQKWVAGRISSRRCDLSELKECLNSIEEAFSDAKLCSLKSFHKL